MSEDGVRSDLMDLSYVEGIIHLKRALDSFMYCKNTRRMTHNIIKNAQIETNKCIISLLCKGGEGRRVICLCVWNRGVCLKSGE